MPTPDQPHELGLPRWWLNDQASVYVARKGDQHAPSVFEHPGLRVSAASAEHLLAMKVLAARRRDVDDIRFLVERLGLASVDAVLSLCAEVFPEEPVPPRAGWWGRRLMVLCTNSELRRHVKREA